VEETVVEVVAAEEGMVVMVEGVVEAAVVEDMTRDLDSGEEVVGKRTIFSNVSRNFNLHACSSVLFLRAWLLLPIMGGCHTTTRQCGTNKNANYN
jgi:hypothetical protein